MKESTAAGNYIESFIPAPMIRRDALAQRGIWNAWPYIEGQAQVVISEGYKDAKQLTTTVDGDDVLSVVHPYLIVLVMELGTHMIKSAFP